MSKIHRRPTAVATAVLVTGILASLAGNLQAINLDNAAPGVGAHISAVFWPTMLFGTVELLIHVPWLANWRDRLTKGGVLILVAAVAGWVSYWHLANVLSHYGYDVASRYAGPLAVDAAMVLAALALNRVGQARRAAGVQLPTAAVSYQYAFPIGPMPAAVPSVQAVVQDTDADMWARLEREMDMSQEPTLPIPVSPAGSVVKRDSVPDTAVDMIQAWATADAAQRPAVGHADKLVAAAHDRSVKTAARWRATVLAG